MYEVRITGFKSKAQAEAFINWYSYQGEQQSPIWFEERKRDGDIDVDTMCVDGMLTFPLAWVDRHVEMVVNPQ